MTPGSATPKKPAAKGRSRTVARARDVDYPANESIGLLMRIALFGLRATFKEKLASYGVPWSSWYYLRVLWEADGITQRELTERVGVMQPNTVSALRQMEKAGLVSIVRDDPDRRLTRVFLTPEGRRLMERILPEIVAASRPVALKGFTKKEESQLRSLLLRVCANVQGAAGRKA